MNCSQARSLFSPYLDGLLTGRQMRDLGNHLAQCAACRQDSALLADTQRAVSSLGRCSAPPELALKLRVAISQESARARERAASCESATRSFNASSGGAGRRPSELTARCVSASSADSWLHAAHSAR